MPIPAFATPLSLSCRPHVHTALTTSGPSVTTPRLARGHRRVGGCVAPARMISGEIARSAIAVYGVTIAGGGIGAFLRSGSKPSIISGVIAGVVLAVAYAKDSVPVALWTAVALGVVFAVRFVKSGKVVPAGLLCLVSVAAAVFFGVCVYG